MDTSGGPGKVVLFLRGDEVVLGRLVGPRPDLALVDALARLQLAALRRGCTIRLDDPCEELRGLLDLVGLAELVGGGLPLEARREAERGEQLEVEEVVQPGDPAL